MTGTDLGGDAPRSPHPPSGPDIDVLADLSANLLSPAEDRRARAHADGCPDCARVLQALDQVGTQLRWLPPIPMPADVAARIDAALAEERTVVSLRRHRDRRRGRQQLLGIAAAGVVVLGGGGVLLSQLTSSDDDSNVAASEPDAAATQPAPLPDLDENSLPGAVADLVLGGDGDEPLRLDGTPAPDNCVADIQIEGVDELIGVIEIRYEGQVRDAIFFRTPDPMVARVIIVDDCSLDEPGDIVDVVKGQI